MSSEKTAKMVISILLLTFIDLALTYGLQCVILAMSSDRSRLGADVVLIFLAGVPVILAQIIFVVLCKKFDRFETREICLAVIINMVLFIVIMLLAFEHIPIAFGIIPSAEMGLGFLQMLIKIFACAEAGICAVISLIIMAINRSQNN